ncbi:MAG: RNA pseudouridine synthase [Rhodobacteraceae bacterium]|nr:RNA pseudouridine synthase [Paracoccaceae bacterium]
MLYRDSLIIIIDKPAGIPVHAGPKGGPNLEDYFDALRFGLPRAPNLAHRLDRDTSGCLVLGRHPKALKKVGALFAANRVEKKYWAVVTGSPPQTEGRIELALRKLTPKAGWKMVVAKSGEPGAQDAITDYKLLGSSGGLSWLELKPHTGRTHQIRVHCAALGCPVAGDPVYGRAAGETENKSDTEAAQLMLHSRAIKLPLYPKRPPVEAEAPPPAHMIELLKRCGWASDPGVLP